MAQRKSPSTPGSANRATGGAARSPKGQAGRGPGGPAGPGAKGPGAKGPGRPPVKKGKSIVNQKQTPWGMIIATVVVVLFAVAVVVVVIATNKSGTDSSDPYRYPEVAAAKKIQGVIYHVEPNHTHKPGHLKYDTTPPTGGNHSQYWADCTGTVYAKPIANENASHMLEHGAIWITYNADKVKGTQLDDLKKTCPAWTAWRCRRTRTSRRPCRCRRGATSCSSTTPSDPRINAVHRRVEAEPEVDPRARGDLLAADVQGQPQHLRQPVVGAGHWFGQHDGRMTADADTATAPTTDRLRRVLGAVIAVALLVLAGAAGWLLRGSGSSGASAVDVGFAQDMATHHMQAVTMAGYERDNTTDSGLKVLAFDIETSQESQVGEMSGWLEAWNKSRNNAHPMSWMGNAHGMHEMAAGGLMPGMATEAQMTKLESLHGKALDVFFLQLMIRHHQGGLPMARYAAAARVEVVRPDARGLDRARRSRARSWRWSSCCAGWAARRSPPPRTDRPDPAG